MTTTNTLPYAEPATSAPVPSRKLIWVGRVITAIPVLMLLMSGVMKVMRVPMVVDGFAKMGYPANTVVPIGIVEIACTVLYVIPRTAVLGAILVTAYLGGATNTHVRAGEPFYGAVLFGVMVWLGLLLREPRLWPLLPLRKPSTNGA